MGELALDAPPALEAGATAEPFESLYRRMLPRVYAYVVSLLRDPSAAEDVTAQAFERAYRRRSSFRSRRGSPEAWLLGIARNAALDELRRRRRRADAEADPVDLASEPSEGAELELRRAAMRQALAASRRGSATWSRSSSRAG